MCRSAAEVDASFDCQAAWDSCMEIINHDIEANLAASHELLVQTGQWALLAECVTLTAAADEEIAHLCNDLWVKVETEKAKGEEHLPSAICRSLHLAAKASPAMANNKGKQASAGKKQKTTLTLDT
jgi:hypothetical protein